MVELNTTLIKINFSDDSYIEIGLGGTIIGYYIILSYQNKILFGICLKWNGMVSFQRFFFQHHSLNDGLKNEKIFNTFINLHPLSFQLNLNSIQVACNVILNSHLSGT